MGHNSHPIHPQRVCRMLSGGKTGVPLHFHDPTGSPIARSSQRKVIRVSGGRSGVGQCDSHNTHCKVPLGCQTEKHTFEIAGIRQRSPITSIQQSVCILECSKNFLPPTKPNDFINKVSIFILEIKKYKEVCIHN